MSSSLRAFEGSRPKAVILGVQLPDVSSLSFDASLKELSRLADTLGLVVVGKVTQRRSALSAAAVVGSGKLKELAGFTGGKGVVPSYAPPGKRARGDESEDDQDREPAASADALAGQELAAVHAAQGAHGAEPGAEPEQTAAADADDDAGEAEFAKADPDADQNSAVGEARAEVVLVDHDLTPSQLRNLEKATGAEVLDRSMVILSIFQRHARTREAKLQVEIARLGYMAPRLREANAGQDRQRGGIGGRGAGESALELDRRRIRDRIAELKRELETVQSEADTRRSRRAQTAAHTVALVGYTNAGKSSLMRALTGDEVYVADQLFATLDTTVRALKPETRPRILVSDTVGFIKQLPHDLVASFRSTLEEAREAGLLLHVVDASDPAFRDQYQVTCKVLQEIGASNNRALLVLNKCDRLTEEQKQAVHEDFPSALVMSARSSADVAALHQRIVGHFEEEMRDDEFVIPFAAQRHVALLHERCRVLDTSYDAEGTRIRVRAPAAVLDALKRELAR
jgi:GTP-binding protein HflX